MVVVVGGQQSKEGETSRGGVHVEGKVRVKELEAMGREQEVTGRGRQIGEKWAAVTGKQKEGKRNRIKVIGDARGRKGKQRDKHSTQACECD